MNTPVVVSTKSAWLSKTNWAAALTGLGAIVTEFTPLLPPQYQGKAIAAVALLGAIATWIIKTFYTDTVTPSSIGPTATPQAATLVTVMRNAGLPEAAITDALNQAQLKK